MRKAITPVISIITLLLITISLAGMGWTYMSGYYEAMTAKQIKLVEGSALANEVMILNIGTSSIDQSDLKVLVGGKDSEILQMEPVTVEPKSSARLVFEFSGLGQTDVRIIGPGNAISYSHDIKVDELDSIVSWWRLDGDGRDSAGGNEGTVYGATPVQGKVGRALGLDGNDYVDVGDGADLYPSGSVTVDGWFRHTGDRGYMLSNWWGSGWRGINLGVYAGPTYYLQFTIGNDVPASDSASAASKYNDGTWYHVAGVYDQENMRLKLYVDGDEIDNKATTINQIQYGSSNSNYVTLGAVTDGTNYFLTGALDEVRLWDRALTENEIKALHKLA